MICGSFPCCGEPFATEMPDGGPFYAEDVCPACGAKIWHKLSRVDPQSWLEADFLAEHTVDPVTRVVEEIAPATPETEFERQFRERYADLLNRGMEHHLIHGTHAEPLGIENFVNDYVGHVISCLVDRVLRDLFPPSPALTYGIMPTRGDEPWRPERIDVPGIRDRMSGKTPAYVIVDEIAPPIREIEILGFGMCEAGRSMDFNTPAIGPLRRMIERLETMPPEPFHYSQLNPVSRNARRGRKRNR